MTFQNMTRRVTFPSASVIDVEGRQGSIVEGNLVWDNGEVWKKATECEEYRTFSQEAALTQRSSMLHCGPPEYQACMKAFENELLDTLWLRSILTCKLGDYNPGHDVIMRCLITDWMCPDRPQKISKLESWIPVCGRDAIANPPNTLEWPTLGKYIDRLRGEGDKVCPAELAEPAGLAAIVGSVHLHMAKRLKDSQQATVRAEAAQALGHVAAVGDTKVAELLRTMQQNDSDERVRAAAKVALEQLQVDEQLP